MIFSLSPQDLESQLNQEVYRNSFVQEDSATLSQAGDSELPGLLNQNDSRQVLHVTYGSALDEFGKEIHEVLNSHEEKHYATIAAHFEKHLKPFVEGSR